MDIELKTLGRIAILEGWVNRFCRRALREIAEDYKSMIQEMLGYALKHSASQSTLHRIFYNRFRERYRWLPVRIIKGCYRDTLRRAKSFKKTKRKGQAGRDRPEMRSVTITYSDSRD